MSSLGSFFLVLFSLFFPCRACLVLTCAGNDYVLCGLWPSSVQGTTCID